MSREGLNGSLGFVTGLVYRRMSNLLLHRLRPYDITPEQWSVLYYAAQADGLIQRELGERAGKDKPTTTRIVDHLVRKGWLARRPDQTDRRAIWIDATAEGRRLIARTQPIEAATVEDVSSCLTAEERETLLDLLHRVGKHLESQKE
ncbi:MarR family winged helix-turn-helix transcriptional regulator [Cohnella sp. JJ-181]|uniref:MarR family winged helix-turn-helix transcriptional regulator n=1 Tax=Cohnella rhizoplanae TaxID=2974897 RepID=UPI0022FFAB71|nr:MarR family transcriptional regulator [Cohnella sp. JJ-181]CAI6053512.1 Multiple antibiotic resistance protein MarR [Cohnella sp. JJ-181]